MNALLDQITWLSLSGAHAHFSSGTSTARRYARGFSPILGFANPLLPDFAALALGESKIPEAIQELEKFWKEHRLSADSKEMVIRALSLARTEQAFAVLFQILAEDDNAARQVVRALAICRHDERIRSDVEIRVKSTGDADLLKLWEREWAH